MAKKDIMIDCDIHPVPDPNRIIDFLSEPWRTRYTNGNRSASNLGYWNINGVMRRDAVLEDGTRIETSPQALLDHHFDAYDIAYGILNMPDLTMAISPEPDFSAAVISAMNDVMLTDWIQVDSRFKMSMHVPINDPQLAVEEIRRIGKRDDVVQILMPGSGIFPLGNRFYHPIYEIAQEYGLTVAIHPGAEGAGISGVPLAGGYPTSGSVAKNTYDE